MTVHIRAPDDSNDPQNPSIKLNTITPDEAELWNKAKVNGTFKQGDRVPGRLYFYICMGYLRLAYYELGYGYTMIIPFVIWTNVSLGAIGTLVIHNPADDQDVDIRTLSGEPDPNGSPIINGKYVVPSKLKAMYIQLFHSLGGGQEDMYINGRKYLGNTPTLVAGPDTLMRFGVIGMGMGSDAHTFHIHGHRWILPGPHGSDPAWFCQYICFYN